MSGSLKPRRGRAHRDEEHFAFAAGVLTGAAIVRVHSAYPPGCRSFECAEDHLLKLNLLRALRTRKLSKVLDAVVDFATGKLERVGALRDGIGVYRGRA